MGYNYQPSVHNHSMEMRIHNPNDDMVAQADIVHNYDNKMSMLRPKVSSGPRNLDKRNGYMMEKIQ